MNPAGATAGSAARNRQALPKLVSSWHPSRHAKKLTASIPSVENAPATVKPSHMKFSSR